MDEQIGISSKKVSVWQGIKDGVFNVFVEMLKDRKVSRLAASIFMLVTFMQIYGTVVVESEYIEWKDDIAADSMDSVFELIRIIPAIIKSKLAGFFWFCYVLSCLQILSAIAAIVYLVYCMVNKRNYVSWPLNFLKNNLLYFYWVCYNPILETLVAMNQCDGEKHIIEDSLNCYSGVHIALMSFSILILLCAICIAVLVALLFQKTHPNCVDTLSHLDGPLQLELIFYRTIIFLLCPFENLHFGIFLVKYILMLSTSILLIYQYIKFLPYFDDFISTLYGFFCFLHAWTLAVSLLTFILSLTGHFIIFLVGVIPIYIVVLNIRTRRIEIILLTQPDKTTSELEAIIQCHALYSLTTSKIAPEQEIRLTGLVNLHQKECVNNHCPLYTPKELYDPCLEKFVDDGDMENLHKNQVFLKHFTKMYFDLAISNFSGLPGIRISYAFFLFNAFQNVHAALTELACAKRNKPNIMQSFEIYKFEHMVETYMQVESQKQKANYYNLAYVIEFERTLDDFIAAIHKTSEAQCSFWTHLQPDTVDFNLLDKDNEHIYEYANDTTRLWNDLCKINPNYSVAATKYMDYIREMRNNDQLANDLQDKLKNESNRKVLSVYAKNNDTLFDTKTAVLHISSARDSLGKILKVNQGAQEVFGFGAIEMLQNSVSKIMPNVIGRRHNELMEQHFKTGRNRIFNKERSMFAMHKDGYCFRVKLLVKPMPKLEDGFMQYVGMIIQIQEDYEYILTDTHGVIDCMSKNLETKLGISGKILHKCGGLNVQILAPELMNCYQEDGKKNAKGQKYKEPGGEELVLTLPNNIGSVISQGMKSRGKRKTEKLRFGKAEKLIKYNKHFNNKRTGKKGPEITPSQMFQMEEYKNCLLKKKVKCEIQDLRFGLGKSESVLSIRVLKISGVHLRKDEVRNNMMELEQPDDKQLGGSEGPDSKKDDAGSKNSEEDKPKSPESPRAKPKAEENKTAEKGEPDPSELDEEFVVSIRPKKAVVPEQELVSPREPLESARKLLDDPGSKTNRQDLAEIPEVAEHDQEKPKESPPEEKKTEENQTKRPPDKKGSLLRNTTIYPSIIEGVDPTTNSPQKKVKIIDVSEVGGKLLVPVDQNEDRGGELALKKHFMMFQLKERKAKEKLAAVANSPEEESEEKKESGAEPGAEPAAEPGAEPAAEQAETKEQKEQLELEQEMDDEDLKDRDEDEEASISSSSTGATIRSNYSIRAAIDEKYVPKSIKNMNYMTIFMFVLLLALAIAYYASEISLYTSIKNNIKNIQYSEERKNSLIDIDMNVKNLILVYEDNLQSDESLSVLDKTDAEKAAIVSESQGNLTLSALSLKEAQTLLSLKTSGIGSAQIAKINPDNVEIEYLDTTADMSSSYMYTIWQAMLEVVVTSLSIANLTTGSVMNDTDPAFYVISQNALNSILVSLNNSTNELVDVIETSRRVNMTVYLVLLIVASAAATISTLVLIPVINTAKKSKEKVLLLFFLLDDAEIKRYQAKCEKFKRLYKIKNDNEDDDKEFDISELEGEAKKEEKKKEEKKTMLRSVKQYDRAPKNYKEIDRGFVSLVIKLLFFVVVIEGYFIIVYFLSYVFLRQVSYLVTELRLLISRAPTHSFLLLIEKEVIMYNDTTTIEYQQASDFISSYHSMMYGEEEQLLDRFSSNKKYHTTKYNSLFKNIIFSNLCEVGLTDSDGNALDVTTCESFIEGILKQGLYASVIKYWDYLRQLNTDFFNSDRQATDIRTFLNEERLAYAETLQSVYFKSALNVLVSQLESDIDSFFSSEFLKDEIIFIAYFIYLIIVYLFVWRMFLNGITRELWKTKSLLSIVPPERLMVISEMRQFILENSGAAFFSKWAS